MIIPELITQIRQQGGLRPIEQGVGDDLFICCASFEPRSKAVCELLQASAYSVKRAILYVNKEFGGWSQTAGNLESMALSLTAIQTNFQGPTIGSWEDSVVQFQELKKAICPGGAVILDKMNITIDVTTFTRESLFSVLAIVRWSYPNATVRLLYVSPVAYMTAPASATKSEPSADTHSDSRWLSRGFRKMRNAIGFAGVQAPQKPSALVMLMGYEVDRTIAIVDSLEPSCVYWGRATDGTQPAFLEENAGYRNTTFTLLKARQPIEEFEFSVKDIDKTTNILRNLLSEVSKTHNVFLTSLTTKLVLVSTFLAVEGNPSVQVTCSLPGEYNIENYSVGTHQLFTYYLPPVLAQ